MPEKKYGDISQPPPPLPQSQLQTIRKGLSLLFPLSRKGHGPGLLLLVPDHTKQLDIENGVPSTLVKWAEEGYVVAEIQASSLQSESDTNTIKEAIAAIKSCEKFDKTEKIGVVAYDSALWEASLTQLKSTPEIVAAVLYSNKQPSDDSGNMTVSTVNNIPLTLHIPGDSSRRPNRSEALTEYFYPKVTSHLFAWPFQEQFHYATEAVSHTRSLMFLKKHMNGPFFDLEDIWEEHTYYEFADRSVEWTMSTMVQEPYVNHVPTLTGGIGREALTKFYRDNFIFNNSADAELELISRTVGIDRVIDEFIFNFTHDQVIDWLVPGVPPTNKKAAVPFTAVVNIRGDRLYHEHIAWDQGSLLRQLGLMPEYLPFPYPLPESHPSLQSGSAQYKVPVDGINSAEKMREKNSVPSNEMFKFKVINR